MPASKRGSKRKSRGRPSARSSTWNVDGIRVEIDETRLGIAVRNDMGHDLERYLDRVSKSAKVIVQKSFGKYQDTGAARNSIRPTRVKKLNQYAVHGFVEAGGPEAPYVKYLHGGADPHVIRARPENPTGMLRFQWTGRQGRVITRNDSPEDASLIGTRRQLADKLVRTPSVNHPGMKGVPFLVMAGYGVTGYSPQRRG